MIVDDDISVLRLLSLLLRTEGFEVLVAVGGAAALTSLEENSPDLMILDLSMPEIDGRMVFKRARDDGFEGPVIICSAFGAEAAKRELGAEAAVSKPFDPDDIISSIRSLLAV